MGNEANSIDEIQNAIATACGHDQYDLCEPSCIEDAFANLIINWNLPKIGIDNNPIDVEIVQPTGGTIFKGQPFNIEADISDSENGEVTSGITTGTPCYVTLGGVSIGTVPYSNDERKCSGTVYISGNLPQGSQGLKVEIADNAGNMGFDVISVIYDTVSPATVTIWKDDEKKDLYYDIDGAYTINWEGGEDATFSHYTLFENGVDVYSGAGNSKYFENDGWDLRI